MLEVLYHQAKLGGALISPAAGAAKIVVRLFVMLVNGRVCAHDFDKKALSTETILIPLGREGLFAPVLNFLRLLPIGDTTKC